MNAPAVISDRAAVRLTAAQFWLLRGFGAFDGYWKSELLDGELWGVPANGDEEPESDATYPIKLTTEYYELLDRAGGFAGHRTELLDGLVYLVSPQYRPHGFIKDELAYRLRRALEELGSKLHVATEQSVSLAPFNEPQPDIILTSEPTGAGPIPGASVALLIEVADSTSKFDRIQKATIYAVADIPEYWVADVNKRVIYRMSNPERSGYGRRDKIDFSELVAAATLDGVSIKTTGL